jgi:hypothetical protein
MLAVCARIRKIARPRQGLLWHVRLEPLAESGLEEPIVAALVAQAIQLAELLACRASYFLGVLALAGTLSVVSTVKAGLRYVEKRARRRDGATEAR